MLSATQRAGVSFALRARRCSPKTALIVLAVVTGGCMVGPDYRKPPAPVADQWLVTGAPRVETEAESRDRWWQVFGDPALDALVDAAYKQNLTLQAAGLRVIEAQARRGIAIGALFPQTQQVSGAYTRTRSSLNRQFVAPGTRDFNTYQVGFDAAWELDFWGRFRRAIEVSDAELLAAVADYDDVLVSLVAEVAITYVNVRVLDQRLLLAHENTGLQRDSLDLARVRYEAGGTSELDVQQATTLLEDTEADIPEIEIQQRQALDSLSVLLGIPPSNLTDILRQSSGIPAPPPTVAVGIPADLLERRPDLRRAERQLAAQSARIGVAVSDLLPRIQLAGSVGLSAEQAAQLFEGASFQAVGGPQFNWPILNYGRIINAVRVQDATFQEQVATYANTVLRAQQEVEDAVVGYLRGADEVAHLERSVAAANRAVELSLVQYREGAADYTRVLNSEQSKITEDRRLTTNRGLVTANVIALYKALGGGWELRDDNNFVPAAAKQEMRERTWWGGMLDTEKQSDDVKAAESGTEGDHDPGFLRWRRWWPEW
jgi:NodT family efflux transporter outer membrane factor (OMF) lipoprotein